MSLGPFTVKDVVPDRGDHRPEIILNPDLAQEHDLSYGDIVRIELGSESVTAYVRSAFGDNLSRYECLITETFDNAVDDVPRTVSLSPDEPPEADRIEVSRPIAVTVSMSLETAPQELVNKVGKELAESLKDEGAPIHVGFRKKQEERQGSAGHTISIYIREINPGLVARPTKDTEVDIRWGR